MKNVFVGIVVILIGVLFLWLGISGGQGIGALYYLGFLLMLGGGFFVTWSIYSKAKEREKEQLKEVLQSKEKEE